jgi:hypothetical protein
VNTEANIVFIPNQPRRECIHHDCEYGPCSGECHNWCNLRESDPSSTYACSYALIERAHKIGGKSSLDEMYELVGSFNGYCLLDIYREFIMNFEIIEDFKDYYEIAKTYLDSMNDESDKQAFHLYCINRDIPIHIIQNHIDLGFDINTDLRNRKYPANKLVYLISEILCNTNDVYTKYLSAINGKARNEYTKDLWIYQYELLTQTFEISDYTISMLHFLVSKGSIITNEQLRNLERIEDISPQNKLQLTYLIKDKIINIKQLSLEPSEFHKSAIWKFMITI